MILKTFPAAGWLLAAIIATGAVIVAPSMYANVPPGGGLPHRPDSAFVYTKHIRVYQCNKTYTDSTLTCQYWYAADSLVRKDGVSMDLPVSSEFADTSMLPIHGQATYETFNPMVCEVAGSSAWNKFTFRYDNQKRLIEVKHFKSFREIVDSKGRYHERRKPAYELTFVTVFKYTPGQNTQITTDDKKKVLEKIVNRYDTGGRLVFQEYSAWDQYFYKIYYDHKPTP